MEKVASHAIFPISGIQKHLDVKSCPAKTVFSFESQKCVTCPADKPII